MKTKRPDGRRSKACSANKGNLERLMREPGRYPVSDAPGMFFKVKAPGKAFWTFRYRFEGKESELSLGAYPETDIKTALGAHAAVRKTLVTDKIDPLAGRRRRRSRRQPPARLRSRPSLRWPRPTSPTRAANGAASVTVGSGGRLSPTTAPR